MDMFYTLAYEVNMLIICFLWYLTQLPSAVCERTCVHVCTGTYLFLLFGASEQGRQRDLRVLKVTVSLPQHTAHMMKITQPSTGNLLPVHIREHNMPHLHPYSSLCVSSSKPFFLRPPLFNSDFPLLWNSTSSLLLPKQGV